MYSIEIIKTENGYDVQIGAEARDYDTYTDALAAARYWQDMIELQDPGARVSLIQK